MDRRRALGIGLVLVAGASFGSGSIFAPRSTATGVDWLTLLGWRFLIGAGLAWAWVALSPSRRGVRPRAVASRSSLVTLALGALSTPATPGRTTRGSRRSRPSLAGVIVYIYPVFVAVLSLRFATRLPGRRPWFALVLALVGVVLALGGIDVSDDPPVEGILLILASAVIYSVWIVLSARLSGERRDRLGDDAPAGRRGRRRRRGDDGGDDDRDGRRVRGRWPSVAGEPLDPADVPSAAWPYLVGVGFLASFLAIQTFYAGARRIGAAQAALVSTTEPV